MQQTPGFGTWKSQFGAEQASSGAVKLRDCTWHADQLYWIESRPAEKGRNTLMHWRHGQQAQEVLPAPWNIRSRVHEYGGRAHCFNQARFYFVEDSDQQIYVWDLPQESLLQNRSKSPQRLTSHHTTRFADLSPHPHAALLVAVSELHPEGAPSHAHPQNELALVCLKTGKVECLRQGADFYSSPIFSPDGKQLAWIEWNHPFMPWDETQLWVADFTDRMENPRQLSTPAPSVKQSITQPKWLATKNGVQLHWMSDVRGWWNLYRLGESGIECVLEMPREFCRPEWNFGQSQYAFLQDGSVFAPCTEDGKWRAGRIQQGQWNSLDLPFTELDSVVSDGHRVAFIAGEPTLPPSVQVWSEAQGSQCVRSFLVAGLSPLTISVAESWHAPGPQGLVPYFFYPPKNPAYPLSNAVKLPPDGELPPLILLCHGGPTAAANSGLNLTVQFWTTRGFAVADVNYSGSTGFGRAFRERLRGQWGELDVQECAAVAHDLVQRKKVHPHRRAIRGSSAGGLTVLNALLHTDAFQAGTSYYGVTDLSALAQETHKFEAHYLDSLVGPWPEARALYQARSPQTHADRLSKPVLFFQGMEDRVVAPSQSELLYQRLQARGVPTQYVCFPQEGHGFRRQETIRTCLETELAFYIRVFALA